jgi:hypothetical protein
MRRHQREQPPASAFRGGELRWLITGMLMLVVLFMLMSRLREPGSMAWIAGAARAAAEAKSAGPTAPLPKADGPTDEDSEQAEEVQGEYQALSDGALTLGVEEMASYNRLVFWVKNQSFARLWGRAKKDLAYTYLHDEPNKYRGQLVALDVNIQLVRDAEKNDYGIPLYEVWATTKRSGDRLYDLVVMNLPPKIPIGRPIHERAKFAGYFLKVQGYHPALSKPGQSPEKAPLLIGRLEWSPAPESTTTEDGLNWVWGLVVLALVLAALIAPFTLGRLRRRETSPRGMLTPPPDAVIPVELWLEQSGLTAPDGDKDEGDDRRGLSSQNGP